MAGSNHKREQNLTGAQPAGARRDIFKVDPLVIWLVEHAEAGQYWNTKNGHTVTGVRMLRSAVGAKVAKGAVHSQLSF